METKQEQKVPRTKDAIASTTPIRVKCQTRKKILQKLAKANKRDFGHKLHVEDLVALVITLVRRERTTLLQEAPWSNADCLEALYKDGLEKHGNLSKVRFLRMLISGDAVARCSG